VSEFKPIRPKRGKRVHVSETNDLRETACGISCDGWSLLADEAPTCKRCLRAMLDALN